jgi:hypothetical protein
LSTCIPHQLNPKACGKTACSRPAPVSLGLDGHPSLECVDHTTELPGRGPLERELSKYANGTSEYTSAIIKGATLVTRDGVSKTFDDEASALLALEDWLAEKRQAGFDLKILEWKPFGLLAVR